MAPIPLPLDPAALGVTRGFGHVIVALAQALTIVGLMNAVVAIKMIPVTCFPFGKEIVKQP